MADTAGKGGKKAVTKYAASNHQLKKEIFAALAPFLVKSYGKDGVIYFTTDQVAYDYVLSHNLEIPAIRTGERFAQGGFIEKCIKSGQETEGTIDRNVFGIRLHIWVAPVFSDQSPGEVVGTYGVFTPKMHPVAKAFDVFAPIVAESQPEGAWVGITDLNKITHRYGSERFDLKKLTVGTPFKEGDVAWKAIKQRRKIVEDISVKGNIRMIGIPLFEDDTEEVVGSFGIATPRTLAVSLQEMAARLNTSTQEIASVMQQIAASAGEINLTEGRLAEQIKEIRDISAQINQILEFIKGVADQTKILGINAAIEAARAGEHGRGFGVVAEEIRRLSDQSKQTADQIGRLTREIELKVLEAVKASEGTVKQSQEQAAATEEVTASMTELSQLAERLGMMAASL